MRKLKSRALLKYFIYIPLLILTYILQSTVFPHILLFGAKPLILPVAAAGIALFEGRVYGAAFGLIAGIFCDMSLNQPAIMFTLILTLLGFGIGLLAETALNNSLSSFLFCSVVALLISGAVQMFQKWFLSGTAVSVLATVILRQTLYSLLFTIPVYYISRAVNRILRD